MHLQKNNRPQVLPCEIQYLSNGRAETRQTSNEKPYQDMVIDLVGSSGFWVIPIFRELEQFSIRSNLPILFLKRYVTHSCS